MTLAKGNLSARNFVLTPTEHPISRMSPIVEFPEYCRWWLSIAWSQFPRTIWFASSRDEASGIARLTIDIVAGSASAAACGRKMPLWDYCFSMIIVNKMQTLEKINYQPREIPLIISMKRIEIICITEAKSLRM